jgi:IS5 family transposase
MFRARLDQIFDLDHELPRLARLIDWGFIEERCGAAYSDAVGHPPLPTRLMAGLAIRKRCTVPTCHGAVKSPKLSPYGT